MRLRGRLAAPYHRRMDELRYPIGVFEAPSNISEAARRSAIDELTALPARLRTAVHNLDVVQLATPYRPGGWTLSQVVHHLGDSHLLGFARFKHGLTEEGPIVNPYDQEKWNELADQRLPISVSLNLMDSIHARWSALLCAMRPSDFARPITLPRGDMTLDSVAQLYAWHGRHHVAQITEWRRRAGC